MHLGHHRGDPAHVKILLARAFHAGQALIHVTLHRRFPEAFIRGVDGELVAVFGDFHAGMREDELADVLVERKAVDAVTAGEHDHGGGAVERVTRAHLLGTGLKEVACGYCLLRHPLG